MKKVIVIFYDRQNPRAIDFILDDLKVVFGKYITLDSIFLSEICPDTMLSADAYLVSGKCPLQEVKNYVDDFSKVVKIARDPDQAALDKVSKIPEGNTVLIVNDSYESSVETSEAFYELGVGHLNLVPYDQALEQTGLYRNINIALTPSEPELVPSHIKTIIDIGYRRISVNTMFKLMKTLDLDKPEVKRNLFRHIHALTGRNAELHSSYVYDYLKDEMINRIIDASKIGAILVDQYFEVIYANSKALNIFQVDDRSKLILTKYISGEILSNIDIIQDQILIHGVRYTYNRHSLSLIDETVGYYITFEDIDESLSDNRLSAKGFVAKHMFKDIIHKSKSMDDVIQTASKIASTDHTVLIRGESGTGKELMAQSIHNASHRKNYPFVAVNCAALPESLLESELFGYEKGAFTGAQSKGKIGLFEEANHGTIFLDEIGDISPKLQSRLLRTIQERQIMRVGSDRIIDIDIRLITATNKNLEDAVAAGEFRSDLFFRLNVLPLNIPPLCERKEDLMGLLSYFLGNKFKNLTKSEITCLNEYNWPGNVREVENVSIYYDTLTKIPDYIYDNVNNYKSHGQSPNLDATILELIHTNSSLSHGIGRTALVHLLGQRGLEVSDNRLRVILKSLEERDLITIGKGRGGTCITEKGLILLEDNK